MDNIDHLYKCYEILSEAGDKISDHVAEYKDILKAVEGSSKEKRLASQFIGKFFKYFPDLLDNAIDAQLDLCEDEDMQIRRQAIKDLPKLCEGSEENAAKLGDTLAQLLVLDDPLELQQVNNSLQTVVKMHTKGAIKGIFSQIISGDENIRERCFKFIISKILPLGSSVITKDIEEYLIEEVKKILQDVTADEFHLCMNILSSTKIGHTVNGHAELVRLASEQAELNAEIDPITVEDEIIERFIQCANHAMPYFSQTIKSTAFVIYVCDKLLPLSSWKIISSAGSQGLRLLKVFAEMCMYCDVLDDAQLRIDAVYAVLREYMPLPELNDNSISSSPSFQFSHAECLLYVLHTLGKKNPGCLTLFSDVEKLKDFRARLQYLARGTQGYIKKLEEAVKGKSLEELKSEENQLKLTALKTTSNIGTLIRDLFHSPPIFKNVIQLSWTSKKNNTSGLKRHAPITFGNENGKGDLKKQKPSSDRKIYSPPSGKYSGKVQNYTKTSNRSKNGNNFGNIKRYRRNVKNY